MPSKNRPTRALIAGGATVAFFLTALNACGTKDASELSVGTGEAEPTPIAETTEAPRTPELDRSATATDDADAEPGSTDAALVSALQRQSDPSSFRNRDEPAPSETAGAAETATTTPAANSDDAGSPASTADEPAPPAPATTVPPPPPAPATTTPPPPPPPPSTGPGMTAAEASFLACVRQRESGGNYSINTGNGYYGAYQFLPSTWNSTASHAGRGDLVGVLPSNVSPGDQDAMALHLYRWQGSGPWGGYCG